MHNNQQARTNTLLKVTKLQEKQEILAETGKVLIWFKDVSSHWNKKNKKQNIFCPLDVDWKISIFIEKRHPELSKERKERKE